MRKEQKADPETARLYLVGDTIREKKKGKKEFISASKKWDLGIDSGFQDVTRASTGLSVRPLIAAN